ncbi:MAG: TerD family protein [Pseudomonadota bacterium]
MTNSPAPGQSAPLNHSKSSNERIIVGLSWDAREDKVSAVSHVIAKDGQHDLDINCFVYDQNSNFIDFIGAQAHETIDESGKIYHSGDNMCGSGDGDDETITVELANLPDHYKSLVFLVEVNGKHNFGEVLNPEARLVDSMSNKELLHASLSEDTAKDRNALVFIAITKDSESPSGWTLHNINDYPDISKIEDWGPYLSQYA